MKYRRGVFIVVYRKNIFKRKYLILKRKLHWKGWEFPKGGIRTKEKILYSIKREIKEETGSTPFNVKNHKIKGKYKYKKNLKDRKGIIGQTYQLYSAEIKNKKIKLDKKEHSSYKWVSFKKALKLLTYPNQKKSLKIVERDLK